jgi:glutamyl/glutaminyl-tRNA synthetase
MKDGHSILCGMISRDWAIFPEGVLNWIALMGWGVAEDDVMTLDQMVERFSIDS